MCDRTITTERGDWVLRVTVPNYLITYRMKFVDLSFYELLVEPVLMNVRIFSDPTLLFRLKMGFVV